MDTKITETIFVKAGKKTGFFGELGEMA